MDLSQPARQLLRDTLFGSSWTFLSGDFRTLGGGGNTENSTIKDLDNYDPLYRIVAYKSPAAKYSDDTLEKSLTITTYEDTSKIKLQISPENIKGFAVPAEYLIFYSELSDENIEFLNSIANSNFIVSNTMSSNQATNFSNQTEERTWHVGDPRIGKVEIYSSDGIIKTITEQSECDDFQNRSAGSEIRFKAEQYKDALSGLEVDYSFIAYQEKNSMLGNTEYAKLFEITVHKNSSVMKLYFLQEAVPFGISLSEQERIRVYEAPVDVLDYLYSLV